MGDIGKKMPGTEPKKDFYTHGMKYQHEKFVKSVKTWAFGHKSAFL